MSKYLTPTSRDQGRTIAQIGVAVQLVGFGLFTVIALRFNFVAKRFTSQFESRISPVDEKYVTVDRAERKVRKNWSAILHVTNAACACILVGYSTVPEHGGVLTMNVNVRFVLSTVW